MSTYDMTWSPRSAHRSRISSPVGPGLEHWRLQTFLIVSFHYTSRRKAYQTDSDHDRLRFGLRDRYTNHSFRQRRIGIDQVGESDLGSDTSARPRETSGMVGLRVGRERSGQAAATYDRDLDLFRTGGASLSPGLARLAFSTDSARARME